MLPVRRLLPSHFAAVHAKFLWEVESRDPIQSQRHLLQELLANSRPVDDWKGGKAFRSLTLLLCPSVHVTSIVRTNRRGDQGDGSVGCRGRDHPCGALGVLFREGNKNIFRCSPTDSFRIYSHAVRVCLSLLSKRWKGEIMQKANMECCV